MFNLITSVLCFNLKYDIYNKDGTLIPSTTTCNYFPKEKPNFISINYSKWDNFNQDLLNKIIDAKKYR